MWERGRVPSRKCWCLLRVSGETPRCPRNLRSWPASGRSLSPLRLFSGPRPEGERKKKKNKKTDFHRTDVRIISDCSSASDLVQKEIHHGLLSKRRRPHQRGEAAFVLSVEQRTVWKIKQKQRTKFKGDVRRGAERTRVSPLLRCAVTSETSPWAANWWTDNADGRDHRKTQRRIYGTLLGALLYRQGAVERTYSLLMLGVRSPHSHAACWSDWWSVWTNTLYPCRCSLETLALWHAPGCRQENAFKSSDRFNEWTWRCWCWVRGWTQLTGGPIVTGRGGTHTLDAWLSVLSNNVCINSGFHSHWKDNTSTMWSGNKHQIGVFKQMHHYLRCLRYKKCVPTSFKGNWK